MVTMLGREYFLRKGAFESCAYKSNVFSIIFGYHEIALPHWTIPDHTESLSIPGFKQYFQGLIWPPCICHCVWPGVTQAKGEVAVEQEESSTMIPELARLQQPWERVKLGAAEEAGRAAGASAAMALCIGYALSWCCSACPEQTELTNKSRGTNKPPSMALSENSKDSVGWSRTSWHRGLGRKSLTQF